MARDMPLERQSLRSVVSAPRVSQDTISTGRDDGPLPLELAPREMSAAGNRLGLLVLFSHPSELHKAYEYLSGIACTIQFTEAVHPTPAARNTSSPSKACSKRECDVLTLLAKGYSYAEAAACLGCKLSTVQTHVKHIYAKLGVHSLAQAVHEALQVGLIRI